MPYPPLTPEAIAELQQHEPQIKSRRAYKRWRGVCLTLIDQKPDDVVSAELGIHPRTLQKHQKRYRDEGLAAFEDKPKGTTGPRLLTAEQEAAFFAQQAEAAQAGQMLRASQLHDEYATVAGRRCCLGTIYLALKRNGWSKKAPRPRHPKGDEEAKTLFKKTR